MYHKWDGGWVMTVRLVYVILCVLIGNGVVWAAEEVVDPQRLISAAISGDKFTIGYRKDLADLRKVVKKKSTPKVAQEIKQLQDNLSNDFLTLKAGLGQKSEIRLGAAVILNGLVKNPNLVRRFDDLNKFSIVDTVLNKIEGYHGTEDLIGSFNFVAKKGEKNLTESALDISLVESIWQLNTEIQEAKKNLEKGMIKLSAKIEKTEYIPAPEESPIDVQVRTIHSWPETAQAAKITALQLLAAHAYSQWATGLSFGGVLNQVEKEEKLAESVIILSALHNIHAPAFAVHEEAGQQKKYRIEGLGLLSAQQLHDYARKGNGDLLVGFCKDPITLPHQFKRTVALEEAERVLSIGAVKRIQRRYNICSLLQGTTENEVLNVLKQYDEFINFLSKEKLEQTTVEIEPPTITSTNQTTSTTATGQIAQPTTTTTTTAASTATTTTMPTPVAPPTPLPVASAPPPVESAPKPIDTPVSTEQPKIAPTSGGFFATAWNAIRTAATAVITAPFRLVTYVFNGIKAFFGGR